MLAPKTSAALTKATKDQGSRVKTLKLKLHPRRKKDHEMLRKTMGTARWTYNEVLRTIRDPLKRQEREATLDPKTQKPVSWTKYLRSQILNTDSPAVRQNPWLLETSYDIRDDARKDLQTSLKGCWTKIANGTLDRFSLRFRSRKKSRSESFYVRHRWIVQTKNSIELHLPNIKPIKLWVGGKQRAAIEQITMDCRLQRLWTNEYYLCIPQSWDLEQLPADKSSDEASAGIRVCALDPGVRVFQTVYDVNQRCALQVGTTDMDRILSLCKAQDRLVSKQQNEPKSARRCKLKRAVRRARERIRNLINEVHKQLAVHLARNYDLVMLPKFEVSKMVQKSKRNIGSGTARQMATWAHYRFRQRLVFKCRQHGRCKVALVNEAYTSKTCSCCGVLKSDLGGQKTFVCDSCGSTMDRDINGAKNIFLRNYEAFGLYFPEDLFLGPTPC